MGWDGRGCFRMGWDGVGMTWDGMGREGMGCHGMGWEGKGRHLVGAAVGGGGADVRHEGAAGDVLIVAHDVHGVRPRLRGPIANVARTVAAVVAFDLGLRRTLNGEPCGETPSSAGRSMWGCRQPMWGCDPMAAPHVGLGPHGCDPMVALSGGL